MNFEVGQGIKYTVRGERGWSYGVILQVSSDSITFAEVGDAMGVYCYDDVEASYDTDRDNVRLNDCPPPFTVISGGHCGGAYVDAREKDYITYDRAKCKLHNVSVIDGGVKVSDKVMDEILNHPWEEQLHFQFIRKW